MFMIKGLSWKGEEQTLFNKTFPTRELAKSFLESHLLRDAWKRVWVSPEVEDEKANA